MIRCVFIILCGILAVSRLAAEGGGNFEFGPRTPSAVYDPDGLLDERVEDELARALDKTYRENQVDLMVVILKNIGQAPPEHVAKSFATAWARGPLNAVILHVPGCKDGPWIVPGGALIEGVNPDIVRQSVGDAMRRAALEPNDVAKVVAAVDETSSFLRYWFATAVIRSEHVTAQRMEIRKNLGNRFWTWRFRLFALGAVFLLLLGLVFTILLRIQRRKSRRFRSSQEIRRLGAPHCGGNRAVILLEPPVQAGLDSKPGT
jgi:uncharacterized membrane protein YgcG